MKVMRLIERLSRYNPDADVRFHAASPGLDLDVLSIYCENGTNNPTLKQPKTQFVEIDIGGKPNAPASR